MNEDIIDKWDSVIDNFNADDKLASALKFYVRNIISQNSVIIIDTKHLSLLTGINYDVLNKMINAPENFYRIFSIPKRNGGTRQIAAPYPSLLFIQKWIYKNILLPTTNLQESAKGFIPGLSIVDNASPHLNHKQILKMDIKDFFPSIKINRIVKIFKKLGYYNRIAYTLASLCCKDRCLPQGAPTSPILSNIVMRHIDARIAGLAKHFNITYTRYADDLTFSGECIPVNFIKYITSIIEEGGFIINSNKTRLIGKNARKIITGVSITSGKVTIPKYLKRRLRQEAYYIHKYGYKQHVKHCNLTNDPAYKLRILGKFSYWKSVERQNEYLNTLNEQLKKDLKHTSWWNSLVLFASLNY